MIEIGTLETVLTIGISVGTTLVTFYVKDRLFKAAVEARIAAIESIDRSQHKSIEEINKTTTSLQQEVVLMKQKVAGLDENIKELKIEIRDENEKTSVALNENTAAINKLQGTLEGITQILNQTRRKR